MLNAQMVKIWIVNELITLKTQVDSGFILEVVGRAKIQQLEDFYDLFNLDEVSLEDVTFSDQKRIRTGHIVSHDSPEVLI